MHIVVVLLIVVLLVCTLYILLPTFRTQVRTLWGRGKAIPFPIRNDHGICYAICALNMVLDSDYIREVMPESNGLNAVLRGDYSSLDNAPRGGNPAELVKRWVSQLPDVSENVKFIYDDETPIDTSTIKDELDDGLVLTGIIYECKGVNDVNKDNGPHAIYVSFDDRVDEWVLLTDDREVLVSDPRINRAIRILECEHDRTKLGGTVIIYDNFKPLVLRYEKPNTPSQKMTLKERFSISARPIILYGSMELVDLDPLETMSEEDLRKILLVA